VSSILDSYFKFWNRFLGSLATHGCFANDPLDSC
jgi:hypothetical protein